MLLLRSRRRFELGKLFMLFMSTNSVVLLSGTIDTFRPLGVAVVAGAFALLLVPG